MANVRRIIGPALFIQLLVPLLLSIDLLHNGLLVARISRTQSILLLACCAWIAWSAFQLFRLAKQGTVSNGVRNTLLVVYSSITWFAAIEFGLRIIETSTSWIPSNDTYYRPNSLTVHHTDPKITPGVNGDATFTVNEAGLRGPSLKILAGHSPIYKIIAAGGSTTACTSLNDDKAWPQLLMDRIDAAQKGVYAFVGNTGVDGHTSVETLAVLRTRRKLRDADAYIFLVGVNDLTTAIGFEGGPTQRYLESRAATMGIGSNSSYLWYSHLETYRVIQMIRSARRSPGVREYSPPHDLELYVQGRRLRQRGPIVPLPDLSSSLAEYRGRIRDLERFCGQTGKRCVFLTQPSLWRPGLSSSEEKMLWLGAIDDMEHPRGFVSTADLARAMDLFNQSLLDVCRQDRLECYDLAAAIPKNSDLFYDDVHFNEAGSRMVARFVSEQFLKSSPFASK